MTLRAIFHVHSIKHIHSGEAKVTLRAVFGNGKDGKRANAGWSKGSPKGTIKMTITKPDAIGRFKLGQSYDVEFKPSE